MFWSSAAPSEAEADLAEPTSFFEALRILRSANSHYAAIIHPCPEQVRDLDSVIKGLRLQLEAGVDEAAGDETAYELAVALLWHSNPSLVEEGTQLMDYLLRERWNQRWSTVVHHRRGGATTKGEDGDEAAQRRLVHSAGDESVDDDEWVPAAAGDASARNVVASRSAPTDAASGATSATAPSYLMGAAVRFATAPPPPEDECGSEPPSLVRDRACSSLLTGDRSGTSAAPSSAAMPRSAAASSSAGSAQRSSGTSYTSPGTASASTDALSTASCNASERDEARLATCYYHLAVGHTKLRNNEKALFYLSNAQRLHRRSKEVLLLRRLLCARLHVRHVMLRSVPLLAVGLLFL
ncbi:hypothetical protein NESM_000225400 [Novymonas esmeraldas]|uniref:Uncharacterized protein n=1 Tax=Novymonas esmeraldas TaxID=1808958 RepID=A0AAW0F6G8_9TRYP